MEQEQLIEKFKKVRWYLGRSIPKEEKESYFKALAYLKCSLEKKYTDGVFWVFCSDALDLFKYNLGDTVLLSKYTIGKQFPSGKKLTVKYKYLIIVDKDGGDDYVNPTLQYELWDSESDNWYTALEDEIKLDSPALLSNEKKEKGCDCSCKCNKNLEDKEVKSAPNITNFSKLSNTKQKYIIELVKKNLGKNKIVHKFIDSLIENSLRASYFHVSNDPDNSVGGSYIYYELDMFEGLPVNFEITDLALNIYEIDCLFSQKLKNNHVFKSAKFMKWQYDPDKIWECVKKSKLVVIDDENEKQFHLDGWKWDVHKVFNINDLIVELALKNVAYVGSKNALLSQLLNDLIKEDVMVYKEIPISEVKEYLTTYFREICSFFNRHFTIKTNKKEKGIEVDFLLTGCGCPLRPAKRHIVFGTNYSDAEWKEIRQYCNDTRENLTAEIDHPKYGTTTIRLHDPVSNRNLNLNNIENYLWMIENPLKSLFVEYLQDFITDLYKIISENLMSVYNDDYIVELIKLNKIEIKPNGEVIIGG